MKELFLKSLKENNTEVLKYYSKIIAMAVRSEIEQFHVEHLTDNQMRELNPLIRNAIYKVLFALANSDRNSFCQNLIKEHSSLIPNYWEEPELDEHLHKILDESKKERKIKFKSNFLNEQYQIGNLFYNPITNCIEIRVSFEFKEVPEHKRDLHRNKLSSLLRKEGYQYSPGLFGYIIPG